MATFIDDQGSIFDSDADTLVCPVNCVPGVMGKGLAKAFAERWPHLKSAHRFAVREGYLRPGKVYLTSLKVESWTGAEYRRRGPDAGCVLFPTKDRWQDPSMLSYVEDGLADLVRKGPQGSIAIPALGCGLGGLSWSYVRPLIVERLSHLPLLVLLYPPKST